MLENNLLVSQSAAKARIEQGSQIISKESRAQARNGGMSV